MSYLDNKVSLETLLSYAAEQNRDPLVALLDYMKTKRLSPRWTQHQTIRLGVRYRRTSWPVLSLLIHHVA